MLVLLSIYQAPIGQVLAILASDWLKRVQILLHLIRHLRGLRGFKLTFSTFYRVSSLAQRNLESHKNARYDISMTIHAQLSPSRQRWKVADKLEMLNCSTYSKISTWHILLWPVILPCSDTNSLSLSEHKMPHEQGFRLLIWLPVLWKISNWKNYQISKALN